jgi:hypothetical protein
VIDIEKQYEYAKRLVGELNKDLVHHCILILHDKGINTDKLKFPDTYFYRVMICEIDKRGGFTKKYFPQLIPYDEDETTFEKDPFVVQQILNEMVKEGYKEEVKLFRVYSLNINNFAIPLQKKTGLHRNTLQNCINFVKQTIIERYGSYDN